MKKFDEIIGQALSQEDRELLARHGEPGFLAQAFGIFRGPQAWVMWTVNVAGAATFFAGVYCLWRVFATNDPTDAMQWGILSLFLFQATTLCKIFLGNRVEANRLLREIKRVELQLSLLRQQFDTSS